MDQMQGGMDNGAGTGGAGGFDQGQGQGQPGTGAQPIAPQGGTPQGGTGAQPYQLNPKWQGKSVEDVARAYDELERKLGTQGSDYGKLKQQVEQWQRFGQGFDPILSQFGYSPQRLAQALQAASQRAAQQGDQQGAQQLAAQAKKAWADVAYDTPDKQEAWFREQMTGAVGPVQQQMQQGFQQIVSQGTEYINRYMDLALRAIQAKFDNPNISIEQLLSQAVNIASGQYDPLAWSQKILTAESPDVLRERIVKEERAKWDQEQRNKAMTTFPGGAGASRPLRPSGAGQVAKPAVGRQPEHLQMASAKERFLNKMGTLMPGGE